MSRKGKILVGKYIVSDNFFNGSRIIITHDDQDGTMGVILNKVLAGKKVGGPLDGVVMLHENKQWMDSSEEILPWLLMARSSLNVEKMTEYAAAQGMSLEKYVASVKKGAFGELRTYVGYVSWAVGQLDEEIAAGAWTLAEARRQDVFLPQPPPKAHSVPYEKAILN